MTKTKDDDFFKMKSDQGKTDWSLLPWRAIESTARIMTIAITPKEQGGKGYGIASWQDVPEGFFRYWAAMIRHIIRRFVYNEVIDQESGEPHMGHVICNAAFVFEKDRQWKEDGKYDENFYERKNKDDWYEKAIKDLSETPDDVFIEEKQPTQLPELYCIRCGIAYKQYIETGNKCDEYEGDHHVWRQNEPTQIQLPHDIDYTEIFKQCDDTSENVIRRTCELAKPPTQEKEVYCVLCDVKLIDYIKSNITMKQMRCFHQWDISNSYCVLCNVKLIDYIKSNVTIKQMRCFHQWDISNL